MKLWIPGPTEVRPALLAECARPMIGHRSGDMAALIGRLDPHLRLLFGLAPASAAQVAVHTCSATGLMEGSLLGVGPRVLCVVNGAFSRRWHEIARILGKEAVALEVPWGEAASAEEIARALDERGPFDALAAIASETSTGVLTPLPWLARARERHPRTLLVVDVVSYAAGASVDFDAHGIDLAFAGSQKALALPPGITVLCASARYLDAARAGARRGFYLDPLRIVDGHAKRETPATPCIPLYYALARQLEDISSGATLPARERGLSGAAAWRARFEKHARMLARTRRWAEEQGLEYLPREELCSPTVSCIRAGKVDVPSFLAELKRRGHQVSNGYGDLKNKTFRIGHMGDHTEQDLESLLAAAREALGAQPART